jgi:hypothetical protein
MVLSAHGDEHEDDGGLAHHPYLVFASATDGSFMMGDVEVPVGRDAVTSTFLRAVRQGQLPTFFAELNHTEDSRAIVSVDELVGLLGPQLPGELYFAYVVLSPDLGSVEFVSNRFTVEIQQ